jgi:hypothetical protein
LLENGGERRASVFRIDVDAICEERLMSDITPRQIESPFDWNMQPGFDVLCQEFRQDNLLAEIL